MIVAGFGFRRNATLASLQDAFSLASAGREVHVLATATEKAGAAAFAELSAVTGLPACPIDPDRIAAQPTLSHSAASQASQGTGSLAEAAALAAAGPNAQLLGPRVISSDRMATCALATGDKQ